MRANRRTVFVQPELIVNDDPLGLDAQPTTPAPVLRRGSCAVCGGMYQLPEKAPPLCEHCRRNLPSVIAGIEERITKYAGQVQAAVEAFNALLAEQPADLQAWYEHVRQAWHNLVDGTLPRERYEKAWQAAMAIEAKAAILKAKQRCDDLSDAANTELEKLQRARAVCAVAVSGVDWQVQR